MSRTKEAAARDVAARNGKRYAPGGGLTYAFSADDIETMLRVAAEEGFEAGRRSGYNRAWSSLCVECGPDVRVDEDGCCITCGSTATGHWLSSLAPGVCRSCDAPAEYERGKYQFCEDHAEAFDLGLEMERASVVKHLRARSDNPRIPIDISTALVGEARAIERGRHQEEP